MSIIVSAITTIAITITITTAPDSDTVAVRITNTWDYDPKNHEPSRSQQLLLSSDAGAG